MVAEVSTSNCEISPTSRLYVPKIINRSVQWNAPSHGTGLMLEKLPVYVSTIMSIGSKCGTYQPSSSDKFRAQSTHVTQDQSLPDSLIRPLQYLPKSCLCWGILVPCQIEFPAPGQPCAQGIAVFRRRKCIAHRLMLLVEIGIEARLGHTDIVCESDRRRAIVAVNVLLDLDPGDSTHTLQLGLGIITVITP